MPDPIYICDSATLLEGGKGIRFPVTAGGEDCSAFVVRYGGQPHAYLNRCAHVPMELDWNEGEFFESSGPCRGGRLHPVTVTERDEKIYWEADEFVRPARA